MLTEAGWTKKHGGLSELLGRPELEAPPGWEPTGEDPEKERPWAWDLAFDRWLDSLGSVARGHYRNYWKEFLGRIKRMPWQIKEFDVERWTWFLELGSAPATINGRLQALSSFYNFVLTNCTYPTPESGQGPLHSINPVPPKRWPMPKPHANQTLLTPWEVWVLLESIARWTELGSRDYALYLAYFGTGKPNRQVRLLRCGEVRQQDARAMCCWPQQGWRPLPAGVWLAIQEYIACAKEVLEMQADDYLFTPLEDLTGQFDKIGPPQWRRKRPLSREYIVRNLKAYAEVCQLDATRFTVQSLRYAGAVMRLQAGDDLPALADFLGHMDLWSTRRFLTWANQQPMEDWNGIREALDLD